MVPSPSPSPSLQLSTLTPPAPRTWFNKIGNREMYMNCAAVTITGGGAGLAAPDHPRTFVAQIGTNGCSVPEGAPVEFPDPGVVVQRSPGAGAVLPKGADCV